MFGVFLYLYFLAVGFLYADMLYSEKGIFFRSWMGGVFGNVVLMVGIIVPSMCFDFTILSHIVLVVCSIVPYFVIKYSRKEKFFDKTVFRSAGEDQLDLKTFLAVVIPITLIICVLMTNHILAPFENRGVAAGQSTYGDLQMHLGFVTSIAEQKEFPPEYPFLSGTVLNYPFFVDMLSSSLYLFGTSLRFAILLPSYVISLLLVMGFFILSYALTKRKAASVLATVFFFFCGGFGFSYFFEGAKADTTVFTRIFTGYYKTPTNLNEMNIRWANSICDMIVPQRATMAGWFMVIPAIWMLVEAAKTKSRKQFIILGVIAGCMPMVHTHSFLALGIISAVMLFLYLPLRKDKNKGKKSETGVLSKKAVNLRIFAGITLTMELRFRKGSDNGKKPDTAELKEYIVNWALFAGITLIIALPQLFFWTFSQTSGNDAFLDYQFNWVNHNDPYLWFYLKNWGIIALFAVPAVFTASKDNKKLFAGCLLIFILAEFIKFQPNEYDNNKLFFITYMVLVILVSNWLVMMWDVMRGVKGRVYLAVVVILAGTLSGTLTIGREYYSGATLMTFSDKDIEMAEFIMDNTDENSVFLTTTSHINPVVSLAGRSVYLGSSLYVFFHGMGNEMGDRKEVMKQIYGAYDSSMVRSLAEENGIDYIVIGERERAEFEINNDAFIDLNIIYSTDDRVIYAVE